MLTEDGGPCVYIIKSLTSGKVYVGSSIKGKRRLAQHERDLRKKRHVNPYLQFAWDKHGKADFEFTVIEGCSADDRLKREQWWIDHLRSSDPAVGYNLSHSVVSLAPAIVRSEISKKYWRDMSPEERAEQSAARKAYWDDPEWRAQAEQALARKGDKQRARRKADPDFNARCLSGFEKSRRDPEAEERRKAKIREAWKRPEVIAKQQARKRALVQDPEYMAKHRARAASEESKAKLRAFNKRQWDDPEMKAKRLEGLKKGRDTFWSDPIRRAERIAKMHKARDEAAAKRREERSRLPS